jgi:hypothetical protein
MLWNPGTFREFAGEIPALQAEISAHGTAADWWSSGSRTHGIEEGDRVYLIRTALKPWSVIASGHASGVVYHPPRHSEDGGEVPQQSPGRVGPRARRRAQYADPSGNKLSPEWAATLNRYWESHLRLVG